MQNRFLNALLSDLTANDKSDLKTCQSTIYLQSTIGADMKRAPICHLPDRHSCSTTIDGISALLADEVRYGTPANRVGKGRVGDQHNRILLTAAILFLGIVSALP